MSDQTETWKIVTTGIAVGIGLTSVAVAVLLQLPVGQDFIRAIRQGTQPTETTRLPEGYYYAPDSTQTESKPSTKSVETMMDGRPLPAIGTTSESVTVLMGRTRVPLPQGESLP